ncbi:MAG: CHAT domain-containing protein [Symploca sp. SIO3C6]|nr:CHAT domain-containing protein [Symploca sp. SIO3C6]
MKYRNIIRRRQRKILFILLFLSSFSLAQWFPWWIGVENLSVAAKTATEVTQNSINPKSLVQQAREAYQAGEPSTAVTLLQQAAQAFAVQGELVAQAQALAQANNIQGQLYLAQGQPQLALENFSEAAATYAKIEDTTGVIKSRINQAEALRGTGQYRRALEILEQLYKKNLKDQPDSLLKVIALRSLGISKRLVGNNLDDALKVTEQSLAVAKVLQSPQNIGAAHLVLGNINRDQSKKAFARGKISIAKDLNSSDEETAQKIDVQDLDYQDLTLSALEHYQTATDTATIPNTKIEAQLNRINLLVVTERFLTDGEEDSINQISPDFKTKINDNFADIPQILRVIQEEINQLPPSQAVTNSRINWVITVMKLEQWANFSYQELTDELVEIVAQAKSFNDTRNESYALGQLGYLYQQEEQLEQAQDYTRRALILAQTNNNLDIAYRWQWQLGQILKAQGKNDQAITAYNAAVNTLESIRSDIVSINPDLQFSFQESVELVYREFMDLLLASTDTQPTTDNLTPIQTLGTSTSPNTQNLEKARNLIESLQQAELVNFFRENCLNASPIQIEEVDPTAAVIYPIVLEDRLEVIVSLPNTPLSHYVVSLPRTEVEQTFAQLRQSIAIQGDRSPVAEVRIREGREIAPPNYLELAKKVYDWLIRPNEQDLAASEIKTLVFVLDAPLLNLPMAVLNDGEQFLIEKYAIALTPGLQLLDPKPITRGELTALKAGLSEGRDNFSPLPNVEYELTEINAKIPGNFIFNEEFTIAAIKEAIESAPFPVVHLATHGQFSSDPAQTFILTWDQRLTIDQLRETLRGREEGNQNPIELLVLSACETATGDKRAALGLAGIAVRAGARSTLATLWQVDDQSTAQLMIDFYQELKDTKLSKAQALQHAQVKIIQEGKHPSFWAPFILVGNWL